MNPPRPLLFIGVVLLGAVVTAGFVVLGPETEQPRTQEAETPSNSSLCPTTPCLTSMISGFEILSPIREVAARSDVVVRGALLDHVEEVKPLPLRENPPGQSRGQYDDSGVYVLFHTFKFRVDEYLKGSGPVDISIMRTEPLWQDVRNDRPWLYPDQEYVLFLFDTKEGIDFWGEGFIVKGPAQGFWEMEDGEVTRPLIAPITMSYEELRKEVRDSISGSN